MQPPQNSSPLPDPRGGPGYPPSYGPPSPDPLGGLIPTKNPSALWSYYVGIIANLPPLGFVLGPLALFFGVRALKAHRAQPQIKGKTHAWVGICCSVFAILLHYGLALLLLLAMLSRS